MANRLKLNLALVLEFFCLSSFGLSTNASEWLIGIYGPITSVSQQFLAGAVAFDWDFRKHFEADLVQELGPALVDILNLNPLLQQVGVVIGTSDSNPKVASRTAVDWLRLGRFQATSEDPGPGQKVLAMVGGLHSVVAARIASLGASFGLPQIAWGATSPALSDKLRYPFFLRTIPPDTIQGQAMWAWTQYFKIPSAVIVFGKEPYGEGLREAFQEAAGTNSQRITEVGMPFMPDPESYDFQLAREVLQGVKESGSRFIVMALGGSQASSALYLLEQAGLLGSGHQTSQVLGAESVFPLDHADFQPSHGSLMGFQKLYPVTSGPLWPQFEELWTTLSPAKLYSAEARARYMLDSMAVGLEKGRAPMLSAEDFASFPSDEPGIHMFSAFIFDAAYTVALAINSLLNKGIGLESLSSSNSTELLKEMKATVFDGVTGRVSFNEQGDRDGQFNLWNLQSNTSADVRWAVIGLYDATSDRFKSIKDTVWMTGENSTTVPASLLECPQGFQRESATNLCKRCTVGIGCGFQIEDGFPLGIFGPFTSDDHQALALAVLFDLDFRKNREPELRDRFGPPIVSIPNLHPDLKLKIQIGTSHGRVSAGVETALDWCTGAGDFHKVAGIVGGAFSSVTGPVASTAAVFDVPVVGWGASNPSLSDKTLYPTFSRVNPPDGLLSEAFWAWMGFFSVPSVAFVYARDPFGEGLLQATKDLAALAGQAGRIVAVGIRYQTPEGYDLNDDLVACQTVQETGSKFISLAIPDPAAATGFLYALETMEMLYGKEAYQTMRLGGKWQFDFKYAPSRGFPVGHQQLQLVAQGRLYPKMMDMWRNLTVEDVYGPEASRRYMYDYFKVLLSDPGTVPHLTEADFKNVEPHYLYVFLVDAAYTFVFALNSLLNQGIPPQEIYGLKLLEEVQKTAFEGVTGDIAFLTNGDRQTDIELVNMLLPDSVEGQSVAYWTAGRANFTLLAAATNLTWARGIVSAAAPSVLTACPAGQYWDEGIRLCIGCERNTYSTGSLEEQTRCKQCGPGWVGDTASAATGCVQCSSGSFRINEDDCVPCPAGMYGNVEGQSACIDCQVGRYSSTAGLTECETCGAGFATQDRFKTMSWVTVAGIKEYFYLSGATKAEDCGCDRGTRRNGHDECFGCTEGMVCKGMNEVEILKGYYAGPIVNGGLSVFKCHGDSLRCRGGLPGHTCTDGRKGITCAECEDGKTPSSEDDGSCVECGGSDHGAFVLLLLLSALMLLLMYYVVDTQNRAKGSHALVLAGTSVGMFMTTIQLLAVLGTLPLEYKEPLKSLMASFSFNLDLVRINCVSRSSPLSRYIVKLVMILVIVCFLVIIHVLVVVFYYGRASGWRVHSLMAGIGSLFMAFYITVTSTVLEPLQCQNHPNTRWTILSYPSILCWEGWEHQTMLILGVIMFIMVPLSFMVVCVSAVRQFPSRMAAGDVTFLKAFSFLFIRFQAPQHTFVLKQMMRSFAVAMVLLVPNVVVQVFMLQLVVLVSYTSSLALLPWRVGEANVLDCFQGAFCLLVVCLASLFLEEDDSDLGAMSWLAFLFIATSFVLTLCAVGYGLFKKYVRRSKPYQFFLCHHKAGAGAYTRLLKMLLLEHPKVVAGVFLDSDNLDNLDSLFDYVGNSTSMLVVVCSAEIFSRPWCLGEMCTARLHSVPVCRIGLPDFRRPDEDFIARLSDNLEGCQALAENGISFEMVEITLRWMDDMPVFHIPGLINMDVMLATAERLVTRDWSDVQLASLSMSTTGLRHSRGLEPERVLCPLVHDGLNSEAEATAIILRKLLIPLMAHRSSMVPVPWKSQELPEGAIAAVVLCSNGIFANKSVLHLLSQPFLGALLPVLATTAFQFPGQDFAADLHKQQASWMDIEEATAAGTLVHRLFKEIAVSFVAQHAGEAGLLLAARQTSQRLLHSGLKGSKTNPTGSTSLASASALITRNSEGYASASAGSIPEEAGSIPEDEGECGGAVDVAEAATEEWTWTLDT